LHRELDVKPRRDVLIRGKRMGPDRKGFGAHRGCAAVRKTSKLYWIWPQSAKQE
ncbi:hypothetical protein RRG08_066483, partial [Elysia crispata]